jgi:hypothetical protein
LLDLRLSALTYTETTGLSPRSGTLQGFSITRNALSPAANTDQHCRNASLLIEFSLWLGHDDHVEALLSKKLRVLAGAKGLSVK